MKEITSEIGYFLGHHKGVIERDAMNHWRRWVIFTTYVNIRTRSDAARGFNLLAVNTAHDIGNRYIL